MGLSEANTALHLVIPGEPVAKDRPRFRVVNGKLITYTPTKTKQAEDNIAMIAMLQYKVKPFPKDVELFMDIRFYYNKKDKDLDNMLKLVWDALNRVAYNDDKQIVGVRANKYKDDNPRTKIMILPAP